MLNVISRAAVTTFKLQRSRFVLPGRAGDKRASLSRSPAAPCSSFSQIIYSTQGTLKKICRFRNNFKFHHDRYEVKVKIPTYNLVVQDKKDEDLTFSVMPFDDIKSKVIMELISDVR